jgi:hypothetical protein
LQELDEELITLNHKDLHSPPGRAVRGRLDRPEKTAAAIHQEISREVNAWLARIFAERRTLEQTDMEAVEMGLRATLHQVGARVLQHLLQYEDPASDRRRLPCLCGQSAHYVELRCTSLLTVVGEAEIQRPYYWCASCGEGRVSRR